MKNLTAKQKQILMFIKEKIRDSGYPPTVREVGDRFKITVKGAYDHMKAIEKKGFIHTEQNKSRAIVVTGESASISKSVNIPLVGRIAAGSPVLAEENIEEYLPFPASSFSSGEYFALNVRGDSMTGAGINDGDIAVIKKQNTANNSEIVAAMIENEATLKKFKKEGSRLFLCPENPAYKPIPAEGAVILGKLAAIFRSY